MQFNINSLMNNDQVKNDPQLNTLLQQKRSRIDNIIPRVDSLNQTQCIKCNNKHFPFLLMDCISCKSNPICTECHSDKKQYYCSECFSNIQQSKESKCWSCNNTSNSLASCIKCTMRICENCFNCLNSKCRIDNSEMNKYMCMQCLTLNIINDKQAEIVNKGNCIQCLSSKEIMRFTSYEMVFNYIKKHKMYTASYEIIKENLCKNEIENEVLLCYKCLVEALSYVLKENYGIWRYLNLFGLSEEDEKKEGRISNDKGKIIRNDQMPLKFQSESINLSTNQLQILQEKVDQFQCLNQDQAQDNNCKQTVTILQPQSLPNNDNNNSNIVNNNNKTTKFGSQCMPHQSDQQQQQPKNKSSTIFDKPNSNFINTNSKSNQISSKYEHLSSSIKGQIEIMKHCNQLQKVSLETLTIYLSSFEKHINEYEKIIQSHENNIQKSLPLFSNFPVNKSGQYCINQSNSMSYNQNDNLRMPSLQYPHHCYSMQQPSQFQQSIQYDPHLNSVMNNNNKRNNNANI